MKIITFDLGATMAWACNGGTQLQTGWKTFPDELRSHRFAKILQWVYLSLESRIMLHGLDAVVYETPFARGMGATRSGWGIAGLIEAAASQSELPVMDVAVPTIKKFATGHGKACKEDMIAAARHMGYRGSNEHEADAVCLLKYAEANLEKALT